MKLFKIIIGMLFFFVSFSYANLDMQEQKTTGIGFYSKGMDKANYKDAKIGLKLWIKELAGKNDVIVEVEFYDDFEKMLNDFETKKIENIIMSPYVYIKHKQKMSHITDGGWSARVSKGEFYSYHLIGKKDFDYKREKNLDVVLRSKDLLAKLVLDKTILEDNKHIDKLTKIKNNSRAVMNVFFGKSDLCVVPEHSWATVCEMNPQIKKKLHIIKSSPQIFMPMMALFHKNMSLSLKQTYYEMFNTFSDTAKGKQILAMFKVQNIKKINLESFKPMNLYYNSYLQLQKRRKK